MSNSVQYAGNSPVSNKNLNASQNTPADRAIAGNSDKFNQKIKDPNNKHNKAPVQQQEHAQSQDTQSDTSTQLQTGTFSDSTYQLVMQQLTGQIPGTQRTGTATAQSSSKASTPAEQLSNKVDTGTEQASTSTSTVIEQAISKASTTTEQTSQTEKASTQTNYNTGTTAELSNSKTDTVAGKEITIDKTAGRSPLARGSFGDDTAISQFVNRQAGELTNSIKTETAGDTTDSQQATDTDSTASEAEIAETIAHLVIQQLGSIEALYEGTGFFGDTTTAAQLLSEHLSGSLAAEIAQINQDEGEEEDLYSEAF